MWRKARPSHLSIAIAIASALLLTACPCSTTATFRVGRTPADKSGQPTVLVCPGEAITFTWSTQNAVRTSIDNGVGDVTPVEAGTKDWTAPAVATHFALTAAGEECDAVVPTTVHTIQDGEEYSINMVGEKNVFVWRGRVDLFFASPSIEVTAVRLHEDTAASWPRWNLQRSDVPGISAGPSSSIVIRERTSVTPFPLVGEYTLAPFGESSNAIATGNAATIIAFLRCKRQ